MNDNLPDGFTGLHVGPAPKDAPVEPDFAEQLAGALRFILAFYEPGQRHLDTVAWDRAEKGARHILAQYESAGRQAAPQPEGEQESEADAVIGLFVGLRMATATQYARRMKARIAALEAALRELKAAARATSGGGCRLTSALAKANELLTTARAGKGEG